LGAIQGPIEDMSTSWALTVDDSASLLQWSHSTGEVDYRCNGGWHFYVRWKMMLTTLLRRYHLITTNSPMKEANAKGLEVS